VLKKKTGNTQPFWRLAQGLWPKNGNGGTPEAENYSKKKTSCKGKNGLQRRQKENKIPAQTRSPI